MKIDKAWWSGGVGFNIGFGVTQYAVGHQAVGFYFLAVAIVFCWIRTVLHL